MIYHIAQLNEFLLSKNRGSYFPAQFSRDGFIHCSTKKQVTTVANNWFINSTHLVLLEIDENSLISVVKYENLEGGQDQYPHVYGEIPISAILRFAYFVQQTSGYSFPSEWIEVEP